jgi:hypothetical protein
MELENNMLNDSYWTRRTDEEIERENAWKEAIVEADYEYRRDQELSCRNV